MAVSTVLRRARPVVGGLAVAAVARAVVLEWPHVADSLGDGRATLVVGAWLAGVGALGASLLSWRTLLADLGTPLPVSAAVRVFFVGQLAKYLPGGTVWAAAAQTELARDHGLPRRQTAAVALSSNGLNLAVGLLLTATLGPGLFDLEGGAWAVPAVAMVAAVSVVLLRPRLLTAIVDRGLLRLGRDPLAGSFSSRGLGRAAGWTVLMWLLLGTHAWLLAVNLGAAPASVLVGSLGGFAAAWTMGFLSVVTPAGAGVREYLLVVAFAGSLPGGGPAALALAVLSRALLVAADAVVAVAAIVLHRVAGRASYGSPL